MSLPCLNFSRGFPDFRIKSQLFSMVCKALYDLALLASAASSLPTLAQTLLLGHSELLTTPRCIGSRTPQCLCTCCLLCMECPSPSPPQLVHSTNFSSFFYTQLSFFLLSWVRGLSSVIPQYSMNTDIITFIVLYYNCWKLVCPPFRMWAPWEQDCVFLISVSPKLCTAPCT